MFVACRRSLLGVCVCASRPAARQLRGVAQRQTTSCSSKREGREREDESSSISKQRQRRDRHERPGDYLSLPGCHYYHHHHSDALVDLVPFLRVHSETTLTCSYPLLLSFFFLPGCRLPYKRRSTSGGAPLSSSSSLLPCLLPPSLEWFERFHHLHSSLSFSLRSN